MRVHSCVPERGAHVARLPREHEQLYLFEHLRRTSRLFQHKACGIRDRTKPMVRCQLTPRNHGLPCLPSTLLLVMQLALDAPPPFSLVVQGVRQSRRRRWHAFQRAFSECARGRAFYWQLYSRLFGRPTDLQRALCRRVGEWLTGALGSRAEPHGRPFCSEHLLFLANTTWIRGHFIRSGWCPGRTQLTPIASRQLTPIASRQLTPIASRQPQLTPIASRQPQLTPIASRQPLALEASLSQQHLHLSLV